MTANNNLSMMKFSVKSLWARRSPAFSVTLLVLVAASAQAVTFNTPGVSFNTYDDNCNNGNYSGAGSLTGSVTSGGAGVTLSGNDNVQGLGFTGSCQLDMIWSGTGSGSFPGPTATVTPTFTFTVPPDMTVTTCTIIVTINGNVESQINCIAAASGGTFSLSAQSFPVPATLSSYMVELYTVFHWTNPESTSTFSINVPADTSIDLFAGSSAPTGTPGPPALLLALTGIVFLSLVAFAVSRREPVRWNRT